MKHVEYLIVGAGVSGLSFANFINSEDYLIVEKEPEPGGYCRSIFKEGFIWDYSGHFFHFKNPEIEAYMAGKMAKNSLVKVNKVARIFYKGKYIDFPFQKNIHQLDQKEFFECLHDLYFKKDHASSSFKDMVYNNYGNAIAEKFLIPYNEKLYACDLDTLDKDAMGRFFPITNMDEVIKHFNTPDNSSYNSSFTYPKKGSIQYINALLRGVRKGNMLLNETILSIDLKNKIAKTNNYTIKFEHLISSIPFPKLLDICNINYQKKVFTSNKVLAVNLGFDKKGNKENHWVYFPDKDLRFYRIGYYDNILNSDRMSLYVEIGLKSDEKVNVAREIKAILKQAKSIGIITNQKLLAKHHVIMDPAYVHINKTSQSNLLKMKENLNKKGVYSIGRYGGWKYCSIEDNIIEAKELAVFFNCY